MNISSGFFGGATLFTDFRYSRSGLRCFAGCLSPLRRTTAATAMSTRTRSGTPSRKKAGAFTSPPSHALQNDREDLVLRKLQFPLDRLEAPLFAQGMQERIVLHVEQAWVTHPHCRGQPLQCLGRVAPLR